MRKRCPSCGELSCVRVGRHLFFCQICEVYYYLNPLTGQLDAMNPLLSPPKKEQEEQARPRPPISLWHEFLKEIGMSPAQYRRLPPIVKEGYRELYREWRKRRMKEMEERAEEKIIAYSPFGAFPVG